MRRRLLLAALALAFGGESIAVELARGAARTWYVKAGAPPGGTGSKAAPFASMRQVERAASRGERIVVLPSREVLDGGIALKRAQRLIGAGPRVRDRPHARSSPQVTNTRGARHAGDAVVLADHSTVRNLVIENSHRGAVYGRNVTGVRVLANEVSAHNASCTEGFHIPPFNVPTTVPGIGIPISDGLSNGWAGIMVDAASGEGELTIEGNRVHDADCGDGIDIRLSGTADFRASVRDNVVRDLRQGADFESVLALGFQTRDRSRLVAQLRRNRQTNLGNEEDLGAGPEGADSEGVFINPVDRSSMQVIVSRNTYLNPRGLGGFSANGLEYVTMGDGSRSSVLVEDSRFTEATGDVLEQLGLGTDARMRLRLDDVTATDSRGFAGSGFGNTVLIPGNNADCLLAASGGAGNSIETTIRGGELSGCANNGLTFGSAVANGSGPTDLLKLDVAGATIMRNRGANLRVGNETRLERLSVRVQGTDLSDSGGTGSGLANVSFEELGSTAKSTIDLGGGALDSPGGNCLDGGSLGAFLLGYDVSAERNWWGQAGGPGVGSTLAVGGSLDTEPSLSTPPPGC